METNQFDILVYNIEHYYSALKYLKIIIIGIKKNEVFYDAIGIKAEFLSEATPSSEILFKIPDLIVYQSIRPIQNIDIKQFVMDIKNKTILINNITFDLNFLNNFRGIYLKSHGDYISYFNYRTEWPYYLFKGNSTNKRVNDLINENNLNKDLNRQGYEDIIELSRDYLDCNIGYDWPFEFYLIIPIYILVNLEITDNKIIFTLKCHNSININDIEIATNIEKKSIKRYKLIFGSE